MTAPVPGDFWSKMRDHARAEVERFSRSGFLRNSGLTGTGNALTASQGASIVQHDVPGNTLFKLDPSGEGLDHPRYDLGAPHPTAYALWPNTASTTPVSVAEKIILPHHRRILWNASVTGDAGTQGTCQLYLNGSPLSPLHTSLVGGETDWQDVLTLPDGFYDQLWTAQVMCQVTNGGTGSVRAATWALLGIGTT